MVEPKQLTVSKTVTQKKILLDGRHAKASQWITSLFVAMSLYSYGTAMMDYFLLYPTRGLVGPEEFPVYHSALAEYILPVSVFPFLLLTILNFQLLWFRPGFISSRIVIISLILLLVDWASTVLIQIPLNIELNSKKDMKIIEYIMQTNWLRVFLESAQAVIAFIIILKAIGRANR